MKNCRAEHVHTKHKSSAEQPPLVQVILESVHFNKV